MLLSDSGTAGTPVVDSDFMLQPDAMSTGSAKPDSEDCNHLAGYRALSPWAIGGLVLGLLSLASLVEPALWLVSLAGAIVGAIGLVRTVLHADALAGRSAAVAGLALSLATLAAALVNTALYGHFVRREAVAFADGWLRLLLHDEPQRALILILPPVNRPRPDADAETRQRVSESLRGQLQELNIKKLLGLGPTALTRCNRVAWLSQGPATDLVELHYTITALPADGDEPPPEPLRLLILAERHRGEAGVDWEIKRWASE